MNSNRLHFFLVFVSTLLIISCAKRGSIGGGPKDEEAPIFVKSSPPNFSTSFKNKEIRIYFDELVTIQDAQQVIVSPPMKIKPEITPVGYPAKFIKIQFKDTLLAETTYNINFGSSIVDNNEKNPVKFFQFVFSTGKVLDSLTFKGSVKDAFKQKLDENIAVYLYEVNETYTDSAVYKDFPRYISNTLDSTLFEFKNIKAGNYKLIALQDKANNYTYESKLDKIGFLSKTISIPEDTIAEVVIFKEVPEFRFTRANQLSKNQFSIGYEGNLENPELSILGVSKDSIQTTFFKDPKKDTLNLWVKPFFAQDSLVILTKSKTVTDTLVSRYKDQFKDSLKLNVLSKKIKLKEDMVITANTPFGKFNETLASFVNQDTLPIPYTQEFDSFKNELKVIFEKKEDSRYALKLLPGAITDFLDGTNDTIVLKVNTQLESEYGKLFLKLGKVDAESLIVQLIQGEKIKEEVLLNNGESTIDFTNLNPGDYSIRFIFDDNKNGIRDTGNYLKQIQPEKIYYYPKSINVRANWDVKQDITFDE